LKRKVQEITDEALFEKQHPSLVRLLKLLKEDLAEPKETC
jgi:hypothetical protein